jgi:hypothetical protein
VLNKVARVGSNKCTFKKHDSLSIHVLKHFKSSFEDELEYSHLVEEPWLEHDEKTPFVQREKLWEEGFLLV